MKKSFVPEISSKVQTIEIMEEGPEFQLILSSIFCLIPEFPTCTLYLTRKLIEYHTCTNKILSRQTTTQFL